MTKYETAEKYLRDGGCEFAHCGICPFNKECDGKYSDLGSCECGLELAQAYLAKKEKKMKQDDGWIELKIGDLPPDILVGDYEFQWHNCIEWIDYDKDQPVLSILADLSIDKTRYRPIQNEDWGYTNGNPRKGNIAQVSHEEILESAKKDIVEYIDATMWKVKREITRRLNMAVEDFDNLKSAIIPPEEV